MPAGYLKLKRKLMKKYKSKAAATKHAAKIWNSMMKGTGKTVGRGRK